MNKYWIFVVMLSTHLVFGLWNNLMCRVVVLEGSECRQHRAHSVIKADTGNCIRKCLNRQGLSRLESSLCGSETMVLTG